MAADFRYGLCFSPQTQLYPAQAVDGAELRCTFAFVIIRVITALMTYYGIGQAGIGQGKDPFALASWACWAVPLLLTELVIQGKQVFAGGTRSAA
jgi:hypothetical protein